MTRAHCSAARIVSCRSSTWQLESHRMKNGMPLYVLSAGNEDVIRFDLLVRSGQLDQSQPLQAVFTNRMLREGTVRMTSGEIAERLDYYGGVVDLSSSVNCGFVTAIDDETP